MPARIERYEVVADIDAALAFLAAEGERATVIAGGTDVVLDWQTGRHPIAVALDIHRLPLDHIRWEDKELVIGALVTHRELERSPTVTAHLPALAEAAATVGGVQVRNLGTIGGNVVNAVPSADLIPALLVADARVLLRSSTGSRLVPLAEFFRGPRQTVLRPDELIIEFRLPNLAPAWRSGFIKFGRRKAVALATVNAAVAVRVEGGRIAGARVAGGVVAPVPLRLRQAEQELEGAPVAPEAVERAVRAVGEEVRPRDSRRGSAEYRQALVTVGVRRLLHRLLEIGQGGEADE